MRLNIPLAAGCAYIALWVGMAIMKVGEPPKPQTPAEWYLPFQFLLIFAAPFIAGFCAGREASSD